ncbi:uncharacterized protein PV09_03544 [Verruconis gallopava]|uniref:WW domain-containing protein n=1 Tax=Verruconis gallopava TaxID=253628 RepID=A0A0D1XSE4_9PEZI|nr:uncharacterized protein PV09_03544 [Verruconis gallopava]KIW05681.1 hypothetical protein PV09_03544 [Verruconis gallopava]
MSFLSEFFHHPPSHPEYRGPPQPPPPWISEYDYQSQRWFFVNQQTGERTWNFPQAPGYNGGYGGGGNYPPQQEQKSHTGRNTAIAAVAGLAGGALLMHEGEKVEEHWRRDEEKFEYDKDRFENRVDYDVDRVETDVVDFPDNAARWTGEKVGEVEAIPQDIEYDYDRAKWDAEARIDNAVQDVEDVPDDVAGWVGEKVGEVERFDDRVDAYKDGIEESYDFGRDEARYGDDY